MTYDERRREASKRHNDRLKEELANGYNGQPIPIVNYFFPPRPIIKKDENALQFVHRAKPGLRLVE